MRVLCLSLLLASGCYVETFVHKVTMPSPGILRVRYCDMMLGAFNIPYTTNCRSVLLDLKHGIPDPSSPAVPD